MQCFPQNYSAAALALIKKTKYKQKIPEFVVELVLLKRRKQPQILLLLKLYNI